MMGRGQRSRGDYQGVVFTSDENFIQTTVEKNMKKKSPVEFKDADRNIICMVKMIR
jgi:hypothetical protein